MLGPACSQPVAITISDADKLNIVKIHNDYRRRVASGYENRGANGAQPSASNMREFVNIVIFITIYIS